MATTDFSVCITVMLPICNDFILPNDGREAFWRQFYMYLAERPKRPSHRLHEKAQAYETASKNFVKAMLLQNFTLTE